MDGPEPKPCTRLLRLCKEHHDPRAFFRRELKSLLIRPARHGQPIARFVVSRLSVDQQHIMVSAIALDVTHGHVPRVEHPVTDQRNFLPVREGSDDFDRLRLLRLAVRQPPAEDF